MDHKEFDSKAREALEGMDEHDIDQAMRVKESVWESLDVNNKKRGKFKGIIWFLLGLLLATGGYFLKELIFADSDVPSAIIAKNELSSSWEVQLKELEKRIVDMDRKYEEKNSLIDSLNFQNKKLRNELHLMASVNSKNASPITQNVYIKDTIYLTEFKENTVELEKIIRDTVFIEVPISPENEELMTDNSNNPVRGLKRDKPRSIQFNFRKVKSDNK